MENLPEGDLQGKGDGCRRTEKKEEEEVEKGRKELKPMEV